MARKHRSDRNPFPSESQFRAVDWRPSRKRATRPRCKAWGGMKQAPPAFLAAGALYGFGKGPQARCKHCRRFAFKLSGLCRWHGGKAESLLRPYVSHSAARQKPRSKAALAALAALAAQAPTAP